MANMFTKGDMEVGSVYHTFTFLFRNEKRPDFAF
jgi:hypothetical protein